jgi:Polyketide cyclase / dehydrase and lipid transport
VGEFVATVEVRRIIAGDPQQLYDLIADVTRMGEWSPESAGAEWLTGEPGTVGSTFRGTNRRPWVKWSTICTVVAADPGRRFAFAVNGAGRPVSTWEYEITPRPGGCEVTERTFDRRDLLYKVTSAVTTGLGRRSVRNRRTMEQTLDALARAVQS